MRLSLPSPILRRVPIAALALGALIAPLAARAQDVPSYAAPAAVSADETVHGRISSVDGAFTISVADDRGFIDHVEMHQGTIINPTGLSLSPGMSVTIAGYNAGSSFDANEIDTPYTYSGPIPEPVYYGPGYWYPGFGYGYGPSFSLAFVFGGGGFEHRSFYGRPWDGHRYFGGYVGHGYDRGFGGRDGGGRDGGGARGGIDVHGAIGVRGGHEVHLNSGSHAPPAFAGRAFAGRSYAGATGSYAGRSFAGQRSFAQSNVRSTGGYARSGGNDFARSGGGFARGSGGGSARGGGGGGARGGGGGHGGGSHH